MNEHPEHEECADGCGLDIDHDDECRTNPGGRILCDHTDDDAFANLGLTCAECGTTTATTYVVTQLDPDDPTTRTEVCRSCDNSLYDNPN